MLALRAAWGDQGLTLGQRFQPCGRPLDGAPLPCALRHHVTNAWLAPSYERAWQMEMDRSTVQLLVGRGASCTVLLAQATQACTCQSRG